MCDNNKSNRNNPHQQNGVVNEGVAYVFSDCDLTETQLNNHQHIRTIHRGRVIFQSIDCKVVKKNNLQRHNC